MLAMKLLKVKASTGGSLVSVVTSPRSFLDRARAMLLIIPFPADVTLLANGSIRLTAEVDPEVAGPMAMPLWPAKPPRELLKGRLGWGE
jgi:hypothetical protein